MSQTPRDVDHALTTVLLVAERCAMKKPENKAYLDAAIETVRAHFASDTASVANCVCGHVHATAEQDGVVSVFHHCRECDCREFLAPATPPGAPRCDCGQGDLSALPGPHHQMTCSQWRSRLPDSDSAPPVAPGAGEPELRTAVGDAIAELENDPKTRTCHNVAAALRQALREDTRSAPPSLVSGAPSDTDAGKEACYRAIRRMAVAINKAGCWDLIAFPESPWRIAQAELFAAIEALASPPAGRTRGELEQFAKWYLFRRGKEDSWANAQAVAESVVAQYLTTKEP